MMRPQTGEVAALPVRLDSLPAEIIQAICEEFCSYCNVLRSKCINFPLDLKFWINRTSQRPLCSLCLTSRRMREIAQPVLFHNFHHSTKDLWSRVVPFSRSITENPSLASHVRCIKWVKPVKRPAQGLAQQEILEKGHMQQIYHGVLLQIISNTTNLSALDVQIEPSLIKTPIRLPRLRFMCLSLGLNVIGAPPTPGRILSDIFESPNVVNLYLNDWVLTGSSCQDIVRSMPHIDNITMVAKPGGEASENEDFGTLIRDLPNLTTVTLFHMTMNDELLSQILPAKDRLTVLVVSFPIIDFSLLMQFTALDKLQITGNIQQIPTEDNEADDIALPVGIPTSIRTLTLREIGTDKIPIARLLRRLSYQLSKYERLKFVNIDSLYKNADYEALVRENLKRAGVSPTRSNPAMR